MFISWVNINISRSDQIISLFSTTFCFQQDSPVGDSYGKVESPHPKTYLAHYAMLHMTTAPSPDWLPRAIG